MILHNFDMDNLTGWIVGAIGSIATWILSARKTKKQLQKSELENVNQAIKIWREMAEELKEELQESKEYRKKLLDAHNECERHNLELQKKISDLNAKMAQLELKIEKMKK